MDLVITLLKGLATGLFWGIVFLFLATLLLPDRIFAKLLKRIKPDFTSRSEVLARVKMVLDYLLNKKDVVIEERTSPESRESHEGIADLVKEKNILESNLFFLDLLKSLAAMTHFSVVHAGYGVAGVCSVLEQSMDYLMNYAKEIQDSKSIGNQRERIYLSAESLQRQIVDTGHFLATLPGEEKGHTVQLTLKQGTDAFDSFMRAEFESTRTQLSRVKQILADRLMEYIGRDL